MRATRLDCGSPLVTVMLAFAAGASLGAAVLQLLKLRRLDPAAGADPAPDVPTAPSDHGLGIHSVPARPPLWRTRGEAKDRPVFLPDVPSPVPAHDPHAPATPPMGVPIVGRRPSV